MLGMTKTNRAISAGISLVRMGYQVYTEVSVERQDDLKAQYGALFEPRTYLDAARALLFALEVFQDWTKAQQQKKHSIPRYGTRASCERRPFLLDQ